MVVDAYPTYGLVGVTNYSLSDHRSGFRMQYDWPPTLSKVGFCSHTNYDSTTQVVDHRMQVFQLASSPGCTSTSHMVPLVQLEKPGVSM
jgi:hypothetical protein